MAFEMPTSPPTLRPTRGRLLTTLALTATMVGLLTLAPVAPAAAETTVDVRVGIHGDKNRMVFDWSVPYRVVEGAGVATIYFDKPAKMDLTAYRKQPLPLFHSVEWKPEKGGTSVRITVPKGATIKHFRLTNRVVFDVYAPTVSASAQTRTVSPAAAASATSLAGSQMSSNSSGLKQPSKPTPAPPKRAVVVPGSRKAAERRMAQTQPKMEPVIKRRSRRRDDSTTRGFSLGVNGSTLGLGGEVGYRFNDYFAVRAGGNYFSYDFDREISGIDYGASIDLMSGGGMVDIYPFGAVFRLTGGVRYNASGIDVKATPTTTTEIGGMSFTPTEIGTMKGEISFWPVAPYAGLGLEWGMFGGHLRMAFDAGVYYQGSPKVKLSNNGTFATDPGFRAELKKEGDSIEDKLSFIQYYPVIGFTVAYRF